MMTNFRSARIAAAILLTGLVLVTAFPAGAHDSDLRLARGAALGRAQEGAEPAAPSRDTMVLVLLGVVVVVVLGRRLLLLTGDKQARTAAGGQAGYGVAGGAICRRCGRAFARHALSPNLLAGKLSRCPHCGKWSIAPRASSAALAAAEAGHAAGPEPEAPALTEEERLRRQIEASKYE